MSAAKDGLNSINNGNLKSKGFIGSLPFDSQGLATPRADLEKNNQRQMQYGCFQKLGYPEMDGENNGKPY